MSTRSAAAFASAAVSLAAAAFTLPLAAPAVATAAGPEVQLGYYAEGFDPSAQVWRLGMLMNAPADVPASFVVRRCDPGAAACDATVPTDTGDGVTRSAVGAGTSYTVPAGTPVGTSWEVTATAGPESTTVRSEPYRGRHEVLTAPSVNGAPRAGGSVTISPASWRDGGFGTFTRSIQLQACTNTAAVTCAVLAEQFWVPTVPEAAWTPASLVVPERYAGWVLRAVDSLEQPESRIPWLAYPAVVAPPPPPVDQRRAVTRGPLVAASTFTAPVAARPVADPDPDPPRAQPRTARASIAGTLTASGRRTLATVRCSQACAVRVTARSGRRSATVVARAAAGTPLAMALPARALRRLAARRLRVTVVIDGTTVVRGETTLGPRLLRRLRA